MTAGSLRCPSCPPARILLVDDDACLGARKAEVLRRHGYEVSTTGDGEAGWEELQTHHYHLLITENELPGLTGVGLVKKLRAAAMPLPVILVTATLPSWESPEYSWLLKADKLLKPCANEDLLRTVRQVLPPVASGRTKSTAPANWASRSAGEVMARRG